MVGLSAGDGVSGLTMPVREYLALCLGLVVLFSRRQPYAYLVRGAVIDEHPAAGFGLDALLRLDGAVDLDPAAGLVAGRRPS